MTKPEETIRVALCAWNTSFKRNELGSTDQTKAAIHIFALRETILISSPNDEGISTVFDQFCTPSACEALNVDLSSLLDLAVSSSQIQTMLMTLKIPPSSIGRLKLQIARKAHVNITKFLCKEDENGYNGTFNIYVDVKVDQALKTKKFNGTESFSPEICVICMDEYMRGAHVTQLSCSHSFHGECIVMWLENMNTCPLCRFEIPIETSVLRC